MQSGASDNTPAVIILVEDETIISLHIAGILKSIGYDVPTVATSGREAIDAAGRIRPDLMLMDIALSGSMDGIDAAEEIRKLYGIPVVYLTANADKATVERAHRTEPFGYINKPISERDLFATIDTALFKSKLEKHLRENEEKYRILFDLESDALFIIDNETGSLIDANISASLLYGYSHEELLTMKNTDLSAEPVETNRVTTATAIDPEQLVFIPLRFHRKKDGTRFPVEITGRFFMMKNRSVHIAAIRDITPRIQAEEELLRSQEDYRIIVNTIPEVIWHLDREGRIGRANRAALSAMKKSEEELLGKTVFDLFPPEQAEIFDRDNRAVIESGEPRLDIIEQYQDGAGKTRWSSTSKYPYINTNGDVQGVIIISREITDGVAAQRELGELESQWRVLLKGIVAAVAVYDAAGVLASCNNPARTLLDIPEGKMEVQASFINCDLELLIREVLLKGKPESRSAGIHRRSIGTTSWVRIDADPVIDGTGTITGVIATFIDLTQIRVFEEKGKD